MKNFVNHNNCLVLNADYRPIGVLSWKKASTLSYRIKVKAIDAQIIKYHANDYIVGINSKIKCPSVIKINCFKNLYNKKIKFTRRNVFCRDAYTCQYCGIKYNVSKLTYDHVIPKSRMRNHAKFTTWTNIVTACQKCNRKKANKTPEEANMVLIKKPTVPQYSTKFLTHHIINSTISMYSEWSDFLG